MFLFRTCTGCRVQSSFSPASSSLSKPQSSQMSSPISPKQLLRRQTVEEDSVVLTMSEEWVFRRLTARASRNSEFFSQLASSLRDETNLRIILAKARETYCAEVFEFLAAILEMEYLPVSAQKQAMARNIVDQFVRTGSSHENHLSSQTKTELLEYVARSELSEDDLDSMFLIAKLEVIEDIKLNPLLRQVAMSCLGGEPIIQIV
ncbi:hypothetical protein BASA81_001904 [Batrachochytrium salamandrivorans]|nr:hypothetical protein BASA81_001904 [Batrachochytrium salamandrivorans]